MGKARSSSRSKSNSKRVGGACGAKFPFVLVHGVLGFGTIGPHGKLEYFRGVMRHLENNPEVLGGRAKVYVADLPATGTITTRAIELRDFIQSRIYDHRRKKLQCEKVHIIAHSMGGLDARYMISNLSMDTGDRSPMSERVASLTTIGTPHLGSPFADFVLDMPVGQTAVNWANLYSIDIAGLEQLSVRFLVKDGFNERMPDRRGVSYYSYAGQTSTLGVLPAMMPSAEVIRRSPEGGANDGVVSVESAKFRYPPLPGSEQVIRADHAAQVGHGYAHVARLVGGEFRHEDFYADLVANLGRVVPGPAAAPARKRAAAR